MQLVTEAQAASIEPGADRCPNPLARVVAAQGEVRLRAGEGAWRAAGAEEGLCPDDELSVAAGARAALRLSNGSNVPLDQNTDLILRGWSADGKTLLVELRAGNINVAAGKSAPIQIMTPHGRIDSSGGEFAVRVTPQQAALSVFQGKAEVNNPEGSLQLQGDETAYFAQWSAPKRDFTVKSQDMVQWTAQSPLFLAPLANKNSSWADAARAYEQGRTVDALIELDRVPLENRNAEYFIFRANIMLFAGRMEEARTNVSKALQLNAQSGEAWAMQSVVSLMSGNAQQALSDAQRAVQLDATSAGAYFALSYALQANRRPGAALEAAQRAVALAPQSALAATRLAELELAAGDRAAAAESAARAEQLDPHLADAKTIRGFVSLSAKNIAEARAAFLAAIQINSADPKSRLGLGLTRIYSGQLQLGREDLELAVSLDPENPLLRTYLGRAYEAEGRTRDAQEQYARAKQLDPRDPTAYFFEALQLAEANQPVSASAQLQAALQRNENRSVYRGQALLAEDQALRVANETAVDRVLGFDDSARVKASDAVSRAPDSAVLHRALGDAMATLPRSQPTRESEYLQATLREPLGSIPVPLFVAESARSSSAVAPQHGFFQAVASTQTGYNEFGAVFNRPQWRTQAETLVAGQNTVADQAYASGSVGPVGFNVSQLHFKTDGFTEFDRLNNVVWRAGLQIDLPTNTRLYAERGHFDSLRRDLQAPGEPVYFAPVETDEQRSRTRFALRQSMGENQEFLALFSRDSMRQNVVTLDYPNGPPAGFNNNLLQRTTSREAQYIFNVPFLNFTLGAANASSESANDLGFGIDSSIVRTRTYYAYLRLMPTPRLQIEGGVSRDRQESDPDFLQGYSNPKFGVRWQVIPGGTLRIAAFSVVNRALATGATLEPTQVGGFNQFYNDGVGFGIRSQNRGVAWDQQLTSQLSYGVERQRRLLAVRIGGGTYDQFQERDTRAYLSYALPVSWMKSALPGWEGGVSVVYDSQDYRRNDPDFTGVEQLQEYTPRHLRFGANLLRDDGMGLNLGLTKVRAHGEHATVYTVDGYPTTLAFGDQFWMADAALSYRLSKNAGQFVLGVMNLTNRRNFQYFEMDPFSPRFAPERYVYGKFLLAF